MTESEKGQLARLAIVTGIERGRVDVRAGRVTPHDEVAAEARAIIEAARAKSRH